MSMLMRKKTKKIHLGNCVIGGGEPITVQAMTNTDTRDVEATVSQILKLEECGCDLIRVAIPDMDAVEAIKKIKGKIHIPLIADIHYDYRLAVAAMENGVDKIRINPGNIHNKEHIKKIIAVAKKNNVPIRIGINSGCVENELIQRYGSITAEALVESVMSTINIFEENNFEQLILAVKGSSVPVTIDAYRILALKTNYPLHIGVTETGVGLDAVIKSSIGIGTLISEGIGDTLRVSLTANIEDQILIGKKILNALEIRKSGLNFVSCPTCGRCMCNASEISKAVYERVKGIQKNIKIAIMGCSVNGPGEAKDADIGLAGGKDEFMLFKKGVIIRKIPVNEVVDAFVKEVNNL